MVIELVGGPKDGTIMEIPEHLYRYGVMHFAVPVGFTAWDGPAAGTFTVSTLEYRRRRWTQRFDFQGH